MKGIKEKMLEFYRNNPVVNAHLYRYLLGHFDYETVLENCVIDLVAGNNELTNSLLDMYAQRPLRSSDVLSERKTLVANLVEENQKLKQQLADRDTADGLLKSQAEAWATVCEALNEHCPGWCAADGVPPIDAAVNAIKSINTNALSETEQYPIIVGMLTYDTERRNKDSHHLAPGMLHDSVDFGFVGWPTPNKGEATPLGQPRNRTFNFKQMIGRALSSKPNNLNIVIKATLSSPYGELPVKFDSHVKVDNSVWQGQHGMTGEDIENFCKWLAAGRVYDFIVIENMFVINRLNRGVVKMGEPFVRDHPNQWLNSTGKKERYTVAVSGDQLVISRVITHTMPE